jgi:hypothetical protein
MSVQHSKRVVYFMLDDEGYEIVRNISNNLDRLGEELDEMGIEFTNRVGESGSDDRHRVIAASLAFTKIVHTAMNTNGRIGQGIVVDMDKNAESAEAEVAKKAIAELARIAAEQAIKKDVEKDNDKGGPFDGRNN